MRYNLNQRDGHYSISSAMRVGGTRKPRSHTVALTDCLVTRADGTQYKIAKDAPRTTRKTRTTGYDAVDLQNKRDARYVRSAKDMAVLQNYEGDN